MLMRDGDILGALCGSEIPGDRREIDTAGLFDGCECRHHAATTLHDVPHDCQFVLCVHVHLTPH